MSASAKQFVDDHLNAHKVVVFSATYCPYCTKAKKALSHYKISDIEILELDNNPNFDDIMSYLGKVTGGETVKYIF